MAFKNESMHHRQTFNSSLETCPFAAAENGSSHNHRCLFNVSISREEEGFSCGFKYKRNGSFTCWVNIKHLLPLLLQWSILNPKAFLRQSLLAPGSWGVHSWADWPWCSTWLWWSLPLSFLSHSRFVPFFGCSGGVALLSSDDCLPNKQKIHFMLGSSTLSVRNSSISLLLTPLPPTVTVASGWWGRQALIFKEIVEHILKTSVTQRDTTVLHISSNDFTKKCLSNQILLRGVFTIGVNLITFYCRCVVCFSVPLVLQRV